MMGKHCIQFPSTNLSDPPHNKPWVRVCSTPRATLSPWEIGGGGEGLAYCLTGAGFPPTPGAPAGGHVWSDTGPGLKGRADGPSIMRVTLSVRACLGAWACGVRQRLYCSLVTVPVGYTIVTNCLYLMLFIENAAV